MYKHRCIAFLVLLVLTALLVSACGTPTTSAPPIIDSGPMDENYVGIVNYRLQKDMKISERELVEGVERVDIKSSLQGNRDLDNQVDSNYTGSDQQPGETDKEDARPRI
ncbi:hypothetical protein [Desulfitibacter alkalitolerans]|uniref:hypothetical protein n=1 Tax=Desulfitibacter alkalitolerans TaxID=264641 RepID=UPI000489FAF4|nr:hypothetical protein [Desulfitibacter alkalitolerans]